ncbi:MAG: hypothetical protein LBN99_07195, partial [Oscillospiraceae bacterium]|nr:hypothetical protein [Oscillospiraceae bacterium]
MHTPVFTERGDPLVIFIHGFMGSPDQFADMADAVVSRGGSALSVLLPGHGGDSREFARCGADAWEAHVRGEIA